MGIAALVAWIVTAGGGFYILAKWVGGGRHRQRSSTRFPPAVLFGHFLLAAAGLVLWIIYLAIGSNPVGWVALVVLASVALLGFVMLGLWIPVYRNSRAAVEAAGQHAGNPEAPPERSFAVPVVAAHGALAVTTMILVLLAMLNSFSPADVDESNLIVAADFEDTTIAREYYFGSGGSFGYSTEQAHGGTHAIKIVNGSGTPHVDGIYLLPHTKTGANSRDPSTAIKVQPGQKFYMQCWVYPDATNTAGGSMVLGAIVRDSTGVNPETYLQAWTGGVPTAGEWTKMSGYIIIPAGYDLLWPVVQSNTDVPTGNTFYYDDVLVGGETASQTSSHHDVATSSHHDVAHIFAAVLGAMAVLIWLPVVTIGLMGRRSK
jgi:hypothetical protein